MYFYSVIHTNIQYKHKYPGHLQYNIWLIMPLRIKLRQTKRIQSAEGFFKTNFDKVKTLLNFERSKVFFCYHTKCHLAQCLPLNLTISTRIVVVPLLKVKILYTYHFSQFCSNQLRSPHSYSISPDEQIDQTRSSSFRERLCSVASYITLYLRLVSTLKGNFQQTYMRSR